MALFALVAAAGDGVWTNNSGGNWSNPNNWAGGTVAGGINAVAAFHTIDITAGRTVTNDVPVTVGTAMFGDTTPSHDWTLTGSTFTLDDDRTKGVLMVSNRTLNITCQVSGTNGFVKTGAGTAVLKSKANDYTGTVELIAGSVTFHENTLGNAANVFAASNGVVTAFAADVAGGFTNVYSVTQQFTVGRGGATMVATNAAVTFPGDAQLTASDTLRLASGANGHLIFSGLNRGIDGTLVLGSAAMDNGTVQIDRHDALGATNSIEMIAPAAGRPAPMLVANYSGFNSFPGEELNRFLPSCTGILSLAYGTANALDFGNAGNLSLASAVPGTANSGGISVNGTISAGADNTFRFGGHEATLALAGLLGGNGKIDVDTVLADPQSGVNNLFVGYGGLVSLNAANTFSGAVVAGPSPDGRATTATLFLKDQNAVQNAASVTVLGSDATKYGAVLLDPSLTYAGPGITSANGAIGWTGDVTLASLPCTFATNTVVGTAGVTPVKLLHLGGPYSAGTMTQSAAWTISDDAGTPVELVKSGTDSTLDVSYAPAGGNVFTGGVRISGGTLMFNDSKQLGVGTNGFVQIAQTGVFELKAGSGNVTLQGKTLDSVWLAGGATVDNGAGIKVTSGDKLTTTSAWEFANVSRMGFRTFGGGIFEYSPPVLTFGVVGSTNTFTIRLEGDKTTLNMNQLPSSRNVSNPGTGTLDVRVRTGETNVFNMLDEPSAPEDLENYKTRYGFQQVQVFGTGTLGSAGTFILNVKEGAMFKNSGRPNQGSSMLSDGVTMILNLEGSNSRFYYGSHTSGGDAGPGVGTLVVRGKGTVGWGDVGVDAKKRIFGLNVSVVFDGGTWNGGTAALDNGRIDASLTFNQDFDRNTDVPRVVSMVVGGMGNTSWNGLVEKTGGSADVWTLSRTGGVVSVDADAALLISSGTMSVGGTVDPFTDSVVPSRHLTITNNSVLTVTAGAKHVGLLAGTGVVSVAGATIFCMDAVSPGTNGIARLTITNAATAGTILDRPGSVTNVFEVNPANTNSDLFKVFGTLSLTNDGPKFAVHLGVAPGASAPGRVVRNIEIVNATTEIHAFDASEFTLTRDPAFLPGELLTIRKGPGSSGGESLYLDFVSNSAPVAVDDSALVRTNVAAMVRVLENDTDADGDTLIVTACTQGANGTVAIMPGGKAVTYTSRPGWFGEDTFTYTVEDGYSGVATGTVAVHAYYPRMFSVFSDHGMSFPDVGPWYFTNRATISASVTNHVVVWAGATQYVCTGWVGSGSLASGEGTNVSFMITSDSSITWLWTTNVFFSRTALANGSVSGDTNGWYAPASSVSVTATPNAYYRFGGWTGVPAAQTNENPLTLVLGQARLVTGRFEANLAPRGTPEWWLALHVLTNDVVDFAVAETNDTDKDTFVNVFEYVAGTDPTNELSYLAATAVSNMPDCKVYFPSVPGRLYDLQGSPSLTGGVWTAVSGQSNKVGTGATLWLVETNAPSPRFYRIGVKTE
jgi:autotransporter-associated beta strand protein